MQDLTYIYKAYYHKFLLENHPDIISEYGDDLEEFLNKIASDASGIYNSALNANCNHHCADEMAKSYLKEGLKSSKFNVIDFLLSMEFPEFHEQLINSKKLTPTVLSLIPECKPVFEKYNFSDDFAYQDEFDKEIIEIIQRKYHLFKISNN